MDMKGLQILNGYYLGLLCLIWSLIGCQQMPVERNATKGNAQFDVGELQWWRVSFEVAWDKKNQPAWYVGPLLADQIISPALKQNEKNIVLWRFHRRAAADETGHRFTFLCFTDATIFSNIQADINNSVVLQKLLLNKQVLRVDAGGLGGKEAALIDATSDKAWSPAMQKTWPYFLMGSSKMWLEQIHIATETLELEAFVEGGDQVTLLARYKLVHDIVSRHWIYEGQHALLHHLSALYGYQPIHLRQHF